MDDEKLQTKWLMLTAAFLFAAIILYNLFFVPRVELTTVVQTDIGSPESAQTDASAAQEPPSAPALVNINTAGIEELDTLPGIGPALAQRIVEYREANGPFASPEDIKKVSGIGDKTFENMADMITVD